MWAHPDDENFLAGALMAAAVRNGQRVVNVTATRGEAGSLDHERWPPDTLAEVRTRELTECLAVLGVDDIRWLDYPDGGCAGISDEAAVAKIAAILDEVGPKTVLTFPLHGLTGHSDHECVSRWTKLAFERAAQPGAALYNYEYTPEWYERFGVFLEEAGAFMSDDRPPSVPRAELAIDFQLSPELTALKLTSAKKHASQIGPMLELLSEGLLAEGMKEETYVLVDSR